ncbi:MAG TPA: alpha/beta hydrolase [Solirubrobacterales bacterium]|nr:alpha/beta hydrolase [Solirubrobacterales bacterium]
MDQERRETRTPDGRRLVFHVAGPERAPLLVFHTGTPGHPHIYSGMIEACAARSLRIACPARPGYAGSGRLKGRTYADNPIDTKVVADKLDAEMFYVLGHSGGGGPALADAALIPGRVRSVAVSATLAPRLLMGRRWKRGLKKANGDEIQAMEAGGSALKRHLKARADEMAKVRTAKQITDNSDFRRFYARVDRKCFTSEYLAFLLKIYSLIGNDHVDGWMDDDLCFFGDWGFDLSRVAAPVTIWQGRKDKIIPVAHARWLKRNVPGAQLRLHRSDGHVSLLNNHFGEMLDDLITRGS